MRFGYMNSPFRSMEKEFRFASDMGLSFIDLTIEHPVPKRESVNPETVKRLAEKYNLELVGHTNWRAPIAHEVEGIRKAAAEEIIKTAGLFRKIGIKRVNVHCDESAKMKLGMEFVRKQHIKSLREIIKHTKKNKQILMLENGPPFETFNEMNRIIKTVPGLKLHLDIGHANLAGEKEIINFITKGRKNLEHIHMHDNLGLHDDHLFAGKGLINWGRVFKNLKKTGYDRTITLETFMIIKKGRHKRASLKERESEFRKQMMFIKRFLK